MEVKVEDLKKAILDVPDYPKEGIIFKDLTTLWKKKGYFTESINLIAEKYKDKGIDKIVAPEARGFIIGAPLAYILNAGFIPVRKKGKLPRETISESYELEYGTETLYMHKDAIEEGDNVLIVDDLIATGGTSLAIANMVKKLNGKVAGFAFLVELEFLKGREVLKEYNVFSIIKY